jgi:Vitamin K-dependent gamma-carboxylase
MMSHSFADAWNSAFHYKELPLTLSVFRILFGLLLSAEAIGLIKWGPDLFGCRGLILESQQARTWVGFIRRCNLFTLGQMGDSWIRAIFVAHTLACVCLAAGLFTKIAATAVFLNFASRSKHNWYVTQGGDNLAKFLSFLMIFSNAGTWLSLDALFNVTSMGAMREASTQWPQRLMQVQISIVYLRTAAWKLKAPEWIDGSASFYSLYKNPHWRWKSYPAILHSAAGVAAMTWSTLLIEVAAGTLLWLRETRYAAMIVVCVFHGAIEIALRLKHFQWLMVICMVLFVPSDVWLVSCPVAWLD